VRSGFRPPRDFIPRPRLPDPSLTAQSVDSSRNRGIRTILRNRAIQRSIERVGHEVTDVSRQEGSTATNRQPISKVEAPNPVFLNMTVLAEPSQTCSIATCTIADQIAAHVGPLSPKQLSPYLGQSPKTIYAKVKKGTIPSMNFDGAIMFDPYTTAAWVRSKSA
jgi:hypothetical protein